MGLSFRSASAISREAANLLGDERYFVAPGSLSDYETLNIPPRHFHKMVTFCAAYSLHLHKMFETLASQPAGLWIRTNSTFADGQTLAGAG